eukprot:70589_1
MGNSSTTSSPNVQLESTNEQKDSDKTNKYGYPPQIRRSKKKQKTAHKPGLISLYPYLTYYKSLNGYSSSSNTFEIIANIIYSYMGNNQIIKNKTFSLSIYLNKPEKELKSNIILCDSSWNGLIYLISPINNKIT